MRLCLNVAYLVEVLARTATAVSDLGREGGRGKGNTSLGIQFRKAAYMNVVVSKTTGWCTLHPLHGVLVVFIIKLTKTTVKSGKPIKYYFQNLKSKLKACDLYTLPVA